MENQDQIIETLKSYVDFEESEIIEFFEKSEYRKLKKNEILIEAGSNKVHLTFVISGCLMTYFNVKKDQSHVLQFGTSMWWTGDLEAFSKGSNSFYSIKTITESEVYLVDLELFENTLKKNPKFERYFRMIFQNALISHQRRIVRNISYSAEERYLEFIKIFPKLELIVPQKHIASYLGITPEFLSKMRNDLRYK